MVCDEMMVKMGENMTTTVYIGDKLGVVHRLDFHTSL